MGLHQIVCVRRLSDTVCLPDPAQQGVFQKYVNSVTEAVHRMERLVREIHHYVVCWRFYPVVQALMAMRVRGVQMIVVFTVIAELGDITRFENPKQLMSYLGAKVRQVLLRLELLTNLAGQRRNIFWYSGFLLISHLLYH